jgi:WD40 repeat protein
MATLRSETVKSEALVLALRPTPQTNASFARTIVAAGYTDGAIHFWDVDRQAQTITLNGHRSPITVLRFNAEGNLLISGSKDTTIVVWDVVAETGLYK